MKMHKLMILVLGMSVLGLSSAQPSGNIGVCLHGDRVVIPGQELRIFTVSVSGARQQGGYYELPMAVTSQFLNFAVIAPQKISVIEPRNPALSCSQALAANTRFVDVTIHYPADYLPYCTIKTSANFRTC